MNLFFAKKSLICFDVKENVLWKTINTGGMDVMGMSGLGVLVKVGPVLMVGA